MIEYHRILKNGADAERAERLSQIQRLRKQSSSHNHKIKNKAEV
jgi:hypothetical protein